MNTTQAQSYVLAGTLATIVVRVFRSTQEDDGFRLRLLIAPALLGVAFSALAEPAPRLAVAFSTIVVVGALVAPDGAEVVTRLGRAVAASGEAPTNTNRSGPPDPMRNRGTPAVTN